MPTTRLRDAANEAARARGARAMGPLGDPDRRRGALDALARGLRGRTLSLGGDREQVEALLLAARAELGAVGPCARRLAESAAACLLRAERADRWERGLEAALEAKGTTMPEALLADSAVRATLALIHRLRRDADAELRRSIDALRRFHAARLAGLFPSGDAAYRAERDLDAALAANEPGGGNVEPEQPLAEAANDDATSPDGPALLRAYRAQPDEAAGHAFWHALSPDEQDALRAAAEAEAERQAG